MVVMLCLVQMQVAVALQALVVMVVMALLVMLQAWAVVGQELQNLLRVQMDQHQ
jgi:hypothetical protein